MIDDQLQMITTRSTRLAINHNTCHAWWGVKSMLNSNTCRKCIVTSSDIQARWFTIDIWNYWCSRILLAGSLANSAHASCLPGQGIIIKIYNSLIWIRLDSELCYPVRPDPDSREDYPWFQSTDSLFPSLLLTVLFNFMGKALL